MSVVISTSSGDFTIDLYTDQCPLTTKNFLKLCKIKYYNGCLFHKVEKDFIAQTGDPTGSGNGGDSIYKFLYGDQARFFSDEINPNLKHADFGMVAMASPGNNLNASQFYITLGEDLNYLDQQHTVFGKVEEGHAVLKRINEAYVDEKGRPYKNIRIKHTYILDDPFDDPPQLVQLIPDKSPEGRPAKEEANVFLEDDWVPLDQQLQPKELKELMRDREAHSHAVVLESIGDIPYAEINPPDNVLFVCNLNSVTQDEDLDTIFSRFGNVRSTEIIRDFRTGDSLTYAFIEFESKESCEQAYFKMDNALIDERRIHVDFSQSVTKCWHSYRRGGKNAEDKSLIGSTFNYALKDEVTPREDSTQKSFHMAFNEDDLEGPRNCGKWHWEHGYLGDDKRSKGLKNFTLGHSEYDRRDSRSVRLLDSHSKQENRRSYNRIKNRENVKHLHRKYRGDDCRRNRNQL